MGADLASEGERADPRSVTAVDRRIGQKIRARRLELGVSQEKLAAAIGVSFQQVQKYEKGLNRVAAGTLHAIAQELNTTVSEFLPEAERTDDEGFAELRAAYYKLNAEGRSMLIASANLFVAEPKLRKR